MEIKNSSAITVYDSSSSPYFAEDRAQGRHRFQNRDRTVLIRNILRLANGKSIARTHLMYKANLSHRMLEAYIAFLLERGFLDERMDKRGPKSKTLLYETTEKGKKYLDIYDSIISLVAGLSKFPATLDGLGEGDVL